MRRITRSRMIKRQLRQYYQEVVRRVQDAHQILILGPGESKNEFKKEMQKSKEVMVKKISVETADKMTERQIAARVKNFFAVSA